MQRYSRPSDYEAIDSIIYKNYPRHTRVTTVQEGKPIK